MFAVPAGTITQPGSDAAAHPARVAMEYARDRIRWAPWLRYDPHERYAALIARSATHEVWLLSWLPGQHTDVHDHDGAEGAFTVVMGTLTEHVLRAEHWTSHAVETGRSRVFGPRHTHRVGNDGLDPAVSLHVYRPERRQRSLT